jgi:hypothetical protein
VEAVEQQIPAAEVIPKAMAGKPKWWEAAEIIGATDRTMRRWREPSRSTATVAHRIGAKRRPSPKRVPAEGPEKILQSFREEHHDFKVRHFRRSCARNMGSGSANDGHRWRRSGSVRAGYDA